MTIFTTRFRILLAGLMLGAASFGIPAAAATVTDATAVEELVRQFTAAQAQQDATVLRDLTSAQYVEISPLGEVDPREKMLGFYTRKADLTPPAIAVEEPTVTLLGDTAIMTAKLHITVERSGQSRSMDMRTSYVAHKEGGRWKLVSMQATPMRPKS